MAEFQTKSKNQTNLKQKPRVYFTCHPDDFDRYFQLICDDIFKTHDCTVYYTEDMTEHIAEKEVELGRNNLFVVPVTYKLLSTPNRAMDEDIPYALSNHIPVLPFMMESEIESFYSAPDKFGALQYLNPYSTDFTEIAYAEKLKKYLDSVLISKKTADRVRAAFDAYIFLSYRKKDRKYANELMRLIHQIPGCYDIAVWFDEFLTPGESFLENIDHILKNSRLFALLVTPNLLEMPNGKPNFVMKSEYPKARKAGIEILPAEMVNTDQRLLKEKFKGLPACINPHDEKALRENFLSAIRKLSVETNNTPEHQFLIGLAYLEGIDVEINRERGLKLITEAAEAALPEAMEKLYDMHQEGIGTRVNYREALKWAERLVKYNIQQYGDENPATINALEHLAFTYRDLGNCKKALEILEKVYVSRCKTFEKNHPDVLAAIENLSLINSDLGNYKSALELGKKAYMLRCKILGEEHPDTLSTLEIIALSYCDLGNYKSALELEEKSYVLHCKILGEEHPASISALNNLSTIHYKMENFQKALELEKKAYTLHCKNHCEDHPNALQFLNNIAIIYNSLGNHQKALVLQERAYIIQCKILGEEHPATLVSLSGMAMTCCNLGNHQKALRLQEKAYTILLEIWGENHPSVLALLSNLAVIYGASNNQKKAIETAEKVYLRRCKLLGRKHPDTLLSLCNLATLYSNLGDYKKALAMYKKSYNHYRNLFGEENLKTLCAVSGLAKAYSDLENKNKKLKFEEKEYNLCCKLLGENHPTTLEVMDKLILTYRSVGAHHKAFELIKKTSRYKKLKKYMSATHQDSNS